KAPRAACARRAEPSVGVELARQPGGAERILGLEARPELGRGVRGEADLLALEDEADRAVRLLEVGDPRRASLEQGIRAEPSEGAELGEAVLADRPARLDE